MFKRYTFRISHFITILLSIPTYTCFSTIPTIGGRTSPPSSPIHPHHDWYSNNIITNMDGSHWILLGKQRQRRMKKMLQLQLQRTISTPTPLAGTTISICSHYLEKLCNTKLQLSQFDSSFSLEEERGNDVENNDVGYNVVQVLPHDTNAFTQGLAYNNGNLYEGTGLHGQSQLRILDIQNPSKTLHSYTVSRHYFGEGITTYPSNPTHIPSSSSSSSSTNPSSNNPNRQQDPNKKHDRIIQLTWQNKKALIYNAQTLQLLEERPFETTTGEGWGITYDPIKHEFIVSDGSPYLHFWDCDTLECKRRILVMANVRGRNCPVSQLNDLAFTTLGRRRGGGGGGTTTPLDRTKSMDSYVYANVWYHNVILLINTSTGNVVKEYDFTALRPSGLRNGNDVFNGVCVLDEDKRQILVTGKMWPYMYKVELH